MLTIYSNTNICLLYHITIICTIPYGKRHLSTIPPNQPDHIRFLHRRSPTTHHTLRFLYQISKFDQSPLIILYNPQRMSFDNQTFLFDPIPFPSHFI